VPYVGDGIKVTGACQKGWGTVERFFVVEYAQNYMTKPISQKYFSSFGQELLGKFRRINNLTTSARGSIGNYHEEILRTSIANFLPNRFSIKSGYIYFDDANVSNQIDILIIDENVPFSYLFKDGNFAIVKPEAAVCAIEVKTMLGPESFLTAFNNIYEAIRVRRMGPKSGFFGLIFAYDTPDPTDQLLHEWFTQPKFSAFTQSSNYWPILIHFFEKKSLLMRKLGEKGDKDGKSYYDRIYQNRDVKGVYPDDRAFHLSILIDIIISACSGPPFPTGLIDFSKSMKGSVGFRPGVGKLP
jgi:hypothetical protein